MKQTLIYRFFTVFMAVVVLFASTGIGLVESQCLLRGKSLHTISNEKPRGCKLCRPGSIKKAAEEGTVFVKRADCCKEKHEFRNVEFLSSFSNLLLKLLKSFTAYWGGFASDFSFVVSRIFSFQPCASYPVQSFSSLLHGRSMLSFVQSFLI